MTQPSLDFDFVQQEMTLIDEAIEASDFELAWEKLEGLFLLHIENWSPEMAGNISKLKQKALQKMIASMRQGSQK